ncbi:MAG: High-affinity nickel transporter [Parcubacteria group bacterium GW2011_GWA2_47_7]|nr:MAG: High-affinity nickel transporter [Parcubacteria group bacterium GW2011_GWA2_47_7]
MGSPDMSLFARFRIKVFGENPQPSVRRGAMLLTVLIFLNILIGVATIILGARYPILTGLAVLSWGFGLRHAMDADHIAAIDNVTRRLLYRGKPSVGVGPYFSLGHSTIVLLLTILIVFFTPLMNAHFESWKEIGAVVGAIISSVFLLLIGIINLGVLYKLIGAWRDLRVGKVNSYHGHMHLGGPVEKLFRPLIKLVDHSYKMYFIGFLFGLGFDTATEVGLLAISALAVATVPPWAVILLPLAFMAGMTLLDTINGLCMLGIYSFGVFDEKRRIFYNINMTLLSLSSALLIGGTIGLRLIAEYLELTGGIFSVARQLSLDNLGYILATLFVASWLIAFFGLRTKQSSEEVLLS